MGESDFVQRITAEGGDRNAACLIRKRLLDWIYVSGFTPYPEDELSQIYGIAEEELDEDLILGILRHLKLNPPTAEALRALGTINTPIPAIQILEDVLHFCQTVVVSPSSQNRRHFFDEALQVASPSPTK